MITKHRRWVQSSPTVQGSWQEDDIELPDGLTEEEYRIRRFGEELRFWLADHLPNPAYATDNHAAAFCHLSGQFLRLIAEQYAGFTLPEKR